jgi:hypothetical protein
MNTKMLLACGSALLAVVSGCVHSPPPADGAGVSAYSVGDRRRVTFDEIVVSIPLMGASAPYQNLHVAPAAFVNPRTTTYASPSEAEMILRRLETRVAARITEVLVGVGQTGMDMTGHLRLTIQREAQAVVDEALRQWERGSDYRVEIVIASLYWTDGSVGRSERPQRFWW